MHVHFFTTISRDDFTGRIYVPSLRDSAFKSWKPPDRSRVEFSACVSWPFPFRNTLLGIFSGGVVSILKRRHRL